MIGGVELMSWKVGVEQDLKQAYVCSPYWWIRYLRIFQFFCSPGASLDGVARTVPSVNPGQIVPMVGASVSPLNVPVMMDTQDQPVKTRSVEKDATLKM